MTPSTVPFAADIAALHDRLFHWPGWPEQGPTPPAGDFWICVQANHASNCSLWAEEDLARRTTVSAREIAANKRAIDRHNQARNDATERMDELLLLGLRLVDTATAASDAPRSLAPAGARLNSETAGSMIDRLSILALKIKAMQLQALRLDVSPEHRAGCEVKLARLQQQRQDLMSCLDKLLADSLEGRAYFKVYRQFKMYNDARFNPALVAEKGPVSDPAQR